MMCPNAGCGESFTRRDMNSHREFNCSWRKVNCKFCKESYILRNKQKHYNVCQKFPVLCTNKCGRRGIPREKLQAHIRDDCPVTRVHCEYKNIGCQEVV
ncbi:TNF receptor-associated factor 5-like [Stylophora pistillata]|uniref:TNF receptor-associated factor 5-like n=1 Tax=Stylophora pistillata TaxID=50429 RepID=UPI000C05787D|nr:TNF receptor-associated factor 5-like [Stylophora pistillata]